MGGQKGEGGGHATEGGGIYSVADMELCPQDFYYSNFSKYYLGSLFYSFKFKFKVIFLKIGIGSYTFRLYQRLYFSHFQATDATYDLFIKLLRKHSIFSSY